MFTKISTLKLEICTEYVCAQAWRQSVDIHYLLLGYFLCTKYHTHRFPSVFNQKRKFTTKQRNKKVDGITQKWYEINGLLYRDGVIHLY